MANVWRRQPSARLRSADFVRDRATDPAREIALAFFEPAGEDPPDPPAGVVGLRMLMGVGL